MRKLKDHQLNSGRVTAIENEISEARGSYDRLKKYIDTRGYTDFRLNEAVWTGSAIYVPINQGTAFIMGYVVQYSDMINIYIPGAMPETTYYFFINTNGTIIYRNTPEELETDMIIGSVSTGTQVDQLITKDLRHILRKDGIYEEVVKARGSYDNLKNYIDSKKYLELTLGKPEVDGVNVKVPIYGGRSYILEQLIEKEDQVFTLLNPNLNTTYYFFLDQHGTIVYDTILSESRSKMILGTLVIGETLDQLITKDLRRILDKDGVKEEVIEARGEYPTLKERLDTEFDITTNIGNKRSAIICIKDILFPHTIGLIQVIIPEHFVMSKVMIRANNAPIGSDLVLDINKNDISIFTDQSTRPRISDGQNSVVVESINVDFYEGDIFSIDIDETGLITPGGKDLMITVKFDQTGDRG